MPPAEIKHRIIIPDFPCSSGSHFTINQFSKCLISLLVFRYDVSVICDNDLLGQKVSHILLNHPEMANKNGELSGLFVVDNHVFMIVNSDRPVQNYKYWVPHYSKHVSGFFIQSLRHSTSYIFDDCDTPVFPVCVFADPAVPMHIMEHDAHSKSVQIEKDIPVFFRGRYIVRVAREYMAEQIKQKIPGTHIFESRSLPGAEYIDLMCRSKIAWCPRSVKSPPDHDCNAVTGREFQAMCLECLVVRPSIGITEVEERVPGVHFVEIQNDSSDLIEKLQYYLEHDDERKEIAHNGRLWWERNSSVTARAQRIFSDCLKVFT